MSQEKKELPPDLDLQARALAALEGARTVPPGPERKGSNEEGGHAPKCRCLTRHVFCKTRQAAEVRPLAVGSEQRS